MSWYRRREKYKYKEVPYIKEERQTRENNLHMAPRGINEGL